MAFRSGIKVQPPGYQFSTEDYDSHQIILVREGLLFLEDARGREKIAAGSTLILFPHTRFVLQCQKQGYRGFYIIGSPFAPEKVPNHSLILPPDKKSLFLCDWLFSQLKRPSIFQKEVSEYLAKALSAEIYAALHEPQIETKGTVVFWTEYFHQLIENSFFNHKGVMEMMKTAPYRYEYLSTAYKKKWGRSPKKHMAEVRIREAKKCLKETHLSVTEIAMQYHYASGPHFSSDFKNHTGFSPEQFRGGLGK